MRCCTPLLIVSIVITIVGVSLLTCGSALSHQAECASSLLRCGCDRSLCLCSGARATCYGQATRLSLTEVGLNLTVSGFSLFIASFYVHELRKRGYTAADFKKLIATMSLTGGSVFSDPSSYKYCLRYYGKSYVLHKILCDLVNTVYNANARPAVREQGYVTQIYRKEIVTDLLSLSPSYLHRSSSASDDGKDEPTSSFLFDVNYELSAEAVRLGCSANGSVRYGVERRHDHRGSFFVRPQFAFGYLSTFHLLQDYKRVLERLQIHTYPVLDRRFEGRGFLASASWGALEAFDRIGGFIDGVEIAHGKYAGIERNALLHALLAFRRNEPNRFDSMQEATETLEGYLLPPAATCFQLTKKDDC